MVSIRPFKPGDMERVLEIEARTYQSPWAQTFFSYIQGKEPEHFLVALDGDEIAGYVVGELREIMLRGIPHKYKMGHIMNITVDTGHRQKGIGSSLMEEIERRFRGQGATKVTLEIRESNTAARSFYQRQGYGETGRVSVYYPNEDAIVMSKEL